MKQEITVIESQRKCADFHAPARALLESLYGERWSVIKKKLAKVSDPEKDDYYMSGVRELAKRAQNLNA